MTNKTKKRIIYCITFIALLIVEVLIALYVHDPFIRPYLGDAIVVAVIYCFARIFVPDKVPWMPVFIFLFAVFVEFTQYIQLVELFGLENNQLARVILGTTFDWSDVLSYGIGCLILLGVEWIKNKKNR